LNFFFFFFFKYIYIIYVLLLLLQLFLSATMGRKDRKELTNKTPEPVHEPATTALETAAVEGKSAKPSSGGDKKIGKRRRIDYDADPLKLLTAKVFKPVNNIANAPVCDRYQPIPEKVLAAAVTALRALDKLAEQKRERKALLDGPAPVKVMVSYVAPFDGKTRFSGVRIQVPHPVSDYGEDMCLIASDQDYRSWKGVIPGVRKVLSVTKLRKQFQRFESRRKLLSSYSFFLADRRILPMLPQVAWQGFCGFETGPAARQSHPHARACAERSRAHPLIDLPTHQRYRVRHSRRPPRHDRRTNFGEPAAHPARRRLTAAIQ
jgi:hypothetical protein